MCSSDLGAARLLVIENSEPALYAVTEALSAREGLAVVEGRIADIRDREGLCQVVFDLEQSPAPLVEASRRLRRESVVGIKGKVRIRAGGANPKLASGEIEIVAEELEIYNKADNPAILPDDHEADKIGEEIRLKYRYLDLRRPRMQHILRTRSRITKFARDYFSQNGFLEIETPLLIKTTPEGARDFIVPARLHPGKWYALPQKIGKAHV